MTNYSSLSESTRTGEIEGSRAKRCPEAVEVTSDGQKIGQSKEDYATL